VECLRAWAGMERWGNIKIKFSPAFDFFYKFSSPKNLMPSFCYICGKPVKQDGLCELHFAKKNPLMKFPSKLYVEVCGKCGSAKLSNRWVPFDLEKFLIGSAEVNGRVDKIEWKNKSGTLEITAKGVKPSSDEQTIENYFVSLTMNKCTCAVCGMISGGYYQAILQIRGKNLQEALDLVRAELAKLSEKDRMAFAREKKVTGGYDLKVGSRAVTKKLASLLKKKYKAKITTSYQQITQIEGKEINRSTYSVRIS